MLSAMMWAASMSMSVTITLAPASARPRAMAAPLPRPAPVTRARRPVRRSFSMARNSWLGASIPRLQLRPGLEVALGGPDARMVEALGLVVGTRYVERHA